MHPVGLEPTMLAMRDSLMRTVLSTTQPWMRCAAVPGTAAGQLLGQHKWQDTKDTCLLDMLFNLSVLLCGKHRHTLGNNLPLLCDKLLQLIDVLCVHTRDR